MPKPVTPSITITPGDVPTPDGSGNGANQYGAFYRPMTGGPSEYWPPARPKPGVPYPNAWIRLIRAGDVFTAWHGTNGTGWDQFAQATADLPASSFVGAATLGHNNSPGNRTTAVYHDFLLMVTPRIVIPPTSLVVTQGSPASLSVTATGGGLTYQWLSNAVALARATNAMLYFSNVQPVHMATYSVRVSNTVGTATSPPVSLTVLAPATIVSQPASQAVSCGAAVTMSVTAGGTPPLSYQWRLEGANVGQATNASLRFSPARLADTGAYSVVISNVAGAVTSAPAMLNVVDNLAPQISCPLSLVVPCGAAGGTHVSFAVSATDDCDSNLVVLCEPGSGAIFPTGTTLVSCRAVDASANTNLCAFTVTVEEPAPVRLAIDRQGMTLLLSWPESCSDHVLEETGDLTDRGGWRRIDPPSIRDGGFYRATILVTNQIRFLRLRRVIP
jgi:hypothetical protein